MLRCNIDVILGLVFGTAGAIMNFLQDADGEVKSIDRQCNDKIRQIEPVITKFEIP